MFSFVSLKLQSEDDKWKSVTWILFDPKLRNFRLLRAARAAIGTLVRKLFDKSSSTRLTKPEKGGLFRPLVKGERDEGFLSLACKRGEEIKVRLPCKLPSSRAAILFLVRISRTSLVMLAKAPGCTSEIRLFVKFTDSSFGWVASTRGLSLSARKKFNDIAIKRHEGGGLMVSLPSGRCVYTVIR